MSSSTIVLQPKYYLEYYNYILDYVLKHYAKVLNRKEKNYIKKLRGLEEDSLCLYLRIAGRRNIFFRASQLQYDEIKSTDKAIAELLKSKLIEKLAVRHEEHIHIWLNAYVKKDLWDAYQLLDEEKELKRSVKKPELLEYIANNIPFKKLQKHFTKIEPVIVQAALEQEQNVRFLFFGNLRGSVTDFVVRDVGHRQFEKVDETQFVPIFKSRVEVDECLLLERIKSDFYILEGNLFFEFVGEWYGNWFDPDKEWTEKARPILDKLLVKIGQFLEKYKQLELALAVFRNTYLPPSRERQARILQKLKRTEEAIWVCEAMLEDPRNIKEEIFAKDFSKRLKKVKGVKSTRKKLKEADEIKVKEKWKHKVEQGALKYYLKKKYKGIHCENSIWRGLFAMVFWDLLYDPKAKAIHHPLQHLPTDLTLPGFYKKREVQIEACLELLDEPEVFQKRLVEIYETKWGISNHLLIWNYDMMECLSIMVKRIKAEPLKAVLRKMCENFKYNSRGFPDLFVWKKKAYWFVEVKSPNDMLSEQQLFWINFFQEHEIKAKVLKVGWKRKKD